MHRLFRALAGAVLVFSAVCGGRAASGAEISYFQEGRKCGRIKDRVQRLLCFDELFKSTLEQAQAEKKPQTPERKKTGPIRFMAMVLEDQRAPGEKNWVMRARPWHQTVLLSPADYDHAFSTPPSNHTSSLSSGRLMPQGQGARQTLNAEMVDIFMTMKETGFADHRPLADEAVLILSCENDITTLGVLLPQPIAALQANLSLSSSSGSLLRLNWRDVENGDVFIAGRGLESIDTIKTIASYERVQLQVTYPEGPRSFVFDMHDLKDRLRPLRTACHW